MPLAVAPPVSHDLMRVTVVGSPLWPDQVGMDLVMVDGHFRIVSPGVESHDTGHGLAHPEGLPTFRMTPSVLCLVCWGR